MISDYHRFGRSVIPLTRFCGHVYCDSCSKMKANDSCPICKDSMPIGGGQVPQPMVNVYVMGLLNINRSRSYQNDEPKMDFEKSLQAKARKSAVIERCLECGDLARVKCIPCKTAYCKRCFGNVSFWIACQWSKGPLLKIPNIER